MEKPLPSHSLRSHVNEQSFAGERQGRQESRGVAEGDRGERGHLLQDPAHHPGLTGGRGLAGPRPHEGPPRNESVSSRDH